MAEQDERKRVELGDLDFNSGTKLEDLRLPRAETVQALLDEIAGRAVEIQPGNWDEVRRAGAVETLALAETIEGYCELVGPLSRAARERKVTPDFGSHLSLAMEFYGDDFEPWFEANRMREFSYPWSGWKFSVLLAGRRYDADRPRSGMSFFMGRGYGVPVEILIGTMAYIAKRSGATEDFKECRQILRSEPFKVWCDARDVIRTVLKSRTSGTGPTLPTEHGIKLLTQAAERIRCACAGHDQEDQNPVIGLVSTETSENEYGIVPGRVRPLKVASLRDMVGRLSGGTVRDSTVNDWLTGARIAREPSETRPLDGVEILKLLGWLQSRERLTKPRRAAIDVLFIHIGRSDLARKGGIKRIQ